MASRANADILPFDSLVTDYHAVDQHGMWYGQKFTRLPDAQKYVADMKRLYPDNPLTLKDDNGNSVDAV